MNNFIFSFFIKKYLIESFHKSIDWNVGVLMASYQILSFSGSRFPDGGIFFNIRNREISVKSFIIFLFS